MPREASDGVLTVPHAPEQAGNGRGSLLDGVAQGTQPWDVVRFDRAGRLQSLARRSDGQSRGSQDARHTGDVRCIGGAHHADADPSVGCSSTQMHATLERCERRGTHCTIGACMASERMDATPVSTPPECREGSDPHLGIRVRDEPLEVEGCCGQTHYAKRLGGRCTDPGPSVARGCEQPRPLVRPVVGAEGGDEGRH